MINGKLLDNEVLVVETIKAGLLSMDLRMLPSKLVYLLSLGCSGSYVPYLNLFFRSIGLSTAQAGVISGLRFITAPISSTAFGTLADSTGRRKLIFLILCLGAFLPILSLPWIASAFNGKHYVTEWFVQTEDAVNTADNNYEAFFTEKDNSSNIVKGNVSTLMLSVANGTISNGNITIRNCSSLNNSTLNLTQGSKELGDKYRTFINVTYTCSHKDYNANALFYTILVLMMTAGFFSVPLAGFIDSIVLNVVKTGRRKANFGSQRAIGSVSFGLANFLAGLAVQSFRHDFLSPYTAIFFVLIPFSILLIPVGFSVLGQCNWESGKPETVERTSIGSALCHLLGKWECVFFMITVVVSGISYNIFYGFVFLFMRDDLNSDERTMTLVIVIASVSEILTFPFTSKIIRYIGGTHRAIITGIFMYFVRYFGMSYVTQAWMVVPIQLLHGFAFSLTWVALVDHVHKITPRQIAITFLSIVHSSHFAIGAILANVLGGEVYDFIGGRTLFRANGVLCGIWTCVMLIFYSCNEKKY